MIIAATSDLHGYLPDPPPWPCDLVIIAGDIMPDKRPIERQGDWCQTTLLPWIEEMTSVTKAPLYLTWGNHDFAAIRLLIPSDLTAYAVVDRGFNILGSRFYFTPWVPNLGRWAYSFDGDVPDRYREAIPDDTQILVTHGPPHGFGDATNNHTSNWEHVGSPSLLERCQAIRVPIVICGHIHEGRGTYETPWQGAIYNVAALDRNYKPRERPWTLINTALHGM